MAHGPLESETSGQDIRVEMHCGLLDWLQFSDTPRRVICRRTPYNGPITNDERAALEVAREYQNEGQISILTVYRGRSLVFIAERVK